MNTHDAIANTVPRAAINLCASDDNDSDGVVVVVSLPLLLSARSLRQSVRSGKKSRRDRACRGTILVTSIASEIRNWNHRKLLLEGKLHYK